MPSLTVEEIRDYWTTQAIRHGQSVAASWSDQSVVEMEIRQIVKYITDGDRVLDIGCANGFSTLEFARQRRARISGRDYIPEMISQAKQRLATNRVPLLGTVDFATGDITCIDEESDTFDKVIVIRVVINLGSWERQLQGIRECARVLKRNGTLLLSEATIQGWKKLNDFRREWHLPDIPMPPFNEYLDQDRLISAVADELELIEVVNFASTYYVGTRVLKPLIAQLTGKPVDVANPLMEWNRWFSQLPSWGDYGTQKLFCFRKR